MKINLDCSCYMIGNEATETKFLSLSLSPWLLSLKTDINFNLPSLPPPPPQSLCTAQNVNCRDLEGRHSTPLHFAAGYNRVSVVEYLLHHGADVHAKDKGFVAK